MVPGIVYVYNHRLKANEYSNRSIADLLGYSPEEIQAMGDRLVEQVVHPADWSLLEEHFDHLQNLPDGQYISVESRHYAKNGSVVWLRGRDTVFERAADGSLLRHVGIATDITAEKEAAERLASANHELEARVRVRTAELQSLNEELEARVVQRTEKLREINRDLKDLTYAATHDLKVPVSNMASLTNMLAEAEPLLTDEHVETLGWMKEVCQQAGEKVDALICVTQARSGAFSAFHDVDLAEVTGQVLADLDFQITDLRASVELDLGVPTVWFLDLELGNALKALVANALKYTRSGVRPRITITSRQEVGHVRISVQDNGTGLSLPRDIDKVFGLFKRAHSHPPGAGVSLYAIRRILERAEGDISVISTLGEGSTFSIRLPNRPVP
ncbi:PAS domain-containing sensor histidine kinase [uncultured Roseobacter sp.]|uniref:sensor histidine kinase n=1 Tax=uncultured Roseobacter sp. TaxID=114847 RepID=UPI0026057C2F|nr:PAS domain-containing sensor histidine kinase [uncultured Roseobacter sp.]